VSMFSAALWVARVSRAGDDILGIADFFLWRSIQTDPNGQEVRFGATPKPPRETRALPSHGLGRGAGVGRALGVAFGRAVGVGLTVAVGVAVGVTLGVAVAVGVIVAVGVAVAVGVGDGVPTAAAISTRPQPTTLFGGPGVPHCL